MRRSRRKGQCGGCLRSFGVALDDEDFFLSLDGFGDEWPKGSATKSCPRIRRPGITLLPVSFIADAD